MVSPSLLGRDGRGSVFLQFKAPLMQRKRLTKQGKIISKPSRRHLGGISKECKRIRVKKIYNKEKPPTSQLAAFCLNERDLYDMYCYQQIILFNNF